MPSALIHYVPILQRAIVGDSPLNAYVVQREQRGVRARADWLLRYLRSVTADGVFLLLKRPPQTAIVPDASAEARFELE